MRCTRCQGCMVRTREEEYCLNCGHRTDYVPPDGSVYGAYREDPKIQVCTEPIKSARGLSPEEKRKRYNAMMRKYMKDRRKDPKQKARQRKYMQEYRLRKKRAALAQ